MAYWNNPYFGVPDNGPPPIYPSISNTQPIESFNETSVLDIPRTYNDDVCFDQYYPPSDYSPNVGYGQNAVWADQLESQQLNQFGRRMENTTQSAPFEYNFRANTPGTNLAQPPVIKSKLTATAVEFKPSAGISTNYQPPVPQHFHSDLNPTTIPSRSGGGAIKKNPTRSMNFNAETRTFHNKRSGGHPKQDNYHHSQSNFNDRRNSRFDRFNLKSNYGPQKKEYTADKFEQSKNDGRKKLLEDAARLIHQSNFEIKDEEVQRKDKPQEYEKGYQNSSNNRYGNNSQRPASRNKYTNNSETADRDHVDQQHSRQSSHSNRSNRPNVGLSFRNNKFGNDTIHENGERSRDNIETESYYRGGQHNKNRNVTRNSNNGKTSAQPDRTKYAVGNSRAHRDNYSTVKSTQRELSTNGNACKEMGQQEVVGEKEALSVSHSSHSQDIITSQKDGIDAAASQRERLTEQMSRGSLECLVCCERVRQNDFIWSCQNCYHILHLSCVRKWATSSKAETGWRCPACQHVSTSVPSDYYCYCGRMKNPTLNLTDIPHSCGEQCSKKSRRPNCPHRCTILCHPGPCPQCEAFVQRKCGCGGTTQSVLCSSEALLECDAVCNKPLSCGVHTCKRKCHTDNCNLCDIEIQQVCFCAKVSRQVKCTSETIGKTVFCCEQFCNRPLNCGNHFCERVCHEGPCDECQLSPSIVVTCACGQTPLTADQERKSCLDPLSCCDKVCSKKLKCGQPFAPHTCKGKCHEGECPPCDLSTLVRCRCGHMDRELPCIQLTGRPDDARCEKKCTKKRSCGRHKCNGLCCIEIDHECMLPCIRMLSCGQHRCEQTCHRGRCLPCYRSSFEELYCECGVSVIFPPVACGTRRPACSQPCSRQHECSHEVLHNCHDEPICPPCTILTHKWCYGKHEMRKTIPCHQKTFSCGRPCGKDLACGRHKCIALCHDGLCLPDGKPCMQPCTKLRAVCGHPCSLPCHDGPCVDSPCKEIVKVTCQCGHRSTMRSCVDNIRDYQRIMTAKIASKLSDIQLGGSTVEIGDIVNNTNQQQACVKTLDCNDECRVIERNRRLAIGLQIRNPDLSAKLTPRYSEFMKQWGKKDPRFCQNAHDKLSELVHLAKQSKQKSRSYSFESMNRDKRQFIHDYCEHFGCESAAYDQEPNRNVVATASRDKAWLPSHSLLEMIQRESGQRKVPGPVLRALPRPATAAASTSQSVSLRLSSRDSVSSRNETPVHSTSMSAITPLPSVISENQIIDYFDGPG